jgi:hypothetical protein
VAVVQGHAWIVGTEDEPVCARPGDVAIVCGPEHYTVADTPETPIQAVIHPPKTAPSSGVARSRTVAWDGGVTAGVSAGLGVVAPMQAAAKRPTASVGTAANLEM